MTTVIATEDNVAVVVSRYTAEALMQVFQVLTHEDNDNKFNVEIDAVWNELVDIFDVDKDYNSKRFIFDPTTTSIVDADNE